MEPEITSELAWTQKTGALPTSWPTYVYRDTEDGSLHEVRYPMGKAPDEIPLDYGRRTGRRVFTTAAVHVRHA